MKKSIYLIFSLLLFSLFPLKAQTYPVSSIDADLMENAYAVIRESKKEFIQENKSNGTYKVTLAITVLKSNGDDYSDIYIYEDDFMELKSFSGEVFDAQGKSVRKITKKNLTTTAYSSHLASAGKTTYYDVYSPSYPYTVKYSYEMKFKNGILNYPMFYPQIGFHCSVEKADYTLHIPYDIELREKKVATNIEASYSNQKNRKVYEWQIEKLKALTYEPYINRESLFPVIYLSPDQFCVEKVCGNMASWETFGKWQHGLLEGRNTLPQNTIDKIHELTNDIAETREKVKVLYEYLQQTTYYVSIQLGIGGWQPMPAQEVAKTGFGDCKALSNYMRAMLDVINIPSYYVPISTEKKHFFSDYPNFSQANHVIVMVPFEQDSLWLECTSQTLPFGYIHNQIAGHDALCIGENDIFFYTLPQYNHSDHREINRINIHLSSNGNANLDVHSTYQLDDFLRMHSMLKGLTGKSLNNELIKLLKVSKPQMTEARKEEFMTDRPAMDLYYKLSSEDYASKTGSRLFIPLNPAYCSLNGIFKGNTRNHDIVLKSGICQIDSISLFVPDNYIWESVPTPVNLESKFGSFKTEIKQDGTTLNYVQTLELLPGHYPVSDFEEIKKFYNQIENIQSKNIGIKLK